MTCYLLGFLKLNNHEKIWPKNTVTLFNRTIYDIFVCEVYFVNYFFFITLFRCTQNIDNAQIYFNSDPFAINGEQELPLPMELLQSCYVGSIMDVDEDVSQVFKLWHHLMHFILVAVVYLSLFVVLWVRILGANVTKTVGRKCTCCDSHVNNLINQMSVSSVLNFDPKQLRSFVLHLCARLFL